MMRAWGITDIGLVRKDNQDAFAIEQDGEEMIAVVCDGMGGVKGGGVASRIAVDTYVDEVKKALRRDMTAEQRREVSAYAVALANRAVFSVAQEEYPGMGTTLVAAVGYDSGVVIVNIGDSRAYHITRDGITRITKDHSLVEDLMERGDITAEEARCHPKRNVITRALGTEETEQSDTYDCPMQPGEYVLLCTDGLINTVTDQEMLYEVIYDEDTEHCLERLIAISKSRGASDNVTAVLIKMM